MNNSSPFLEVYGSSYKNKSIAAFWSYKACLFSVSLAETLFHVPVLAHKHNRLTATKRMDL